ncbi:MAG TPA: hypothetical protein VMX38_06980 [Verrucomicrobiae bacterium]|nr:hypothetical protein [Verrucomicrobiae bacterium]
MLGPLGGGGGGGLVVPPELPPGFVGAFGLLVPFGFEGVVVPGFVGVVVPGLVGLFGLFVFGVLPGLAELPGVPAEPGAFEVPGCEFPVVGEFGFCPDAPGFVVVGGLVDSVGGLVDCPV